MLIAETERLILRYFQEDDVDGLAELYIDPLFTRFFGGPGTWEDARDDIPVFIKANETNGIGFYATIYKPENRFIGRCGLLAQSVDGTKELEVAYGISSAYWGRGLGTEAARALKYYAFSHYDVPRVISIVNQENVASQRVATKNGMRYEKDIDFEGERCRLYVIRREEVEPYNLPTPPTD